MSKKCKRDFKLNQTVYLIDYWSTHNGTKALIARAKVKGIFENEQTLLAILYGNQYQIYNLKDYGRLIFDTVKEANEAADKLPKPKSIVYQKLGNRLYKKTVVRVYGHYVDGVYDLMISFNRGQDVSTKEIGVSVFLNESDVIY